MRSALSLLAIAGAVALAGCNGTVIPIPRETITFTYKFAEQRQPDVYHVQVLRGPISDPPACGNQVEDRMRLEQIAFTAQRMAYPSLVNACSSRLRVDVENARSVNPHLAEFEFHRLSGTSDRRAHMVATNAASGDTFPNPSGLRIELHSAVIEGVKTTHGTADISFGGSGPVYRCAGDPGENF
ncbi:MAG: hypothetical protein ACREDZ_00310 [Kiloniellales bacterium]